MPFPDSKDEKVLICILLDGLGYRLATKIPTLNGLCDSIRPLKTVLGYSCAAQPSILTGLMPDEHGGFCVYYRAKNSIFWWLRIAFWMPPKIRKKLIKNTIPLTRRLYGITGYFNKWQIPIEILPQFQLYEKNSFYSHNPLPNIPTVLDLARSKGKKVASNHWSTPASQIFVQTEKRLIARQASFHYLYIANTDHLLHLNGNNAKTDIDGYAKKIERIIQIARENYQKVQVLIFSDHGMLEVNDTIDPMTQINKLPFRIGKDYLAFYDATMVRLWFKNYQVRELIINILNNTKGLSLLSDHELKKLGSFFPDRRYGEVIYLADGGKIISPSFFGDLNHMKGMHGYHPDEPGYEAFFGSINLELDSAESITDLYPIIAQNLGL